MGRGYLLLFRRVYISYLDSVHYFQPEDQRTPFYHQILIGYLEYVQQLGFTYAYIWACPPKKGDDYIFYCHPVEQRIPGPERLQKWYKDMFEAAKFDYQVCFISYHFIDHTV
jgi:E1A/CREB-binding protein